MAHPPIGQSTVAGLLTIVLIACLACQPGAEREPGGDAVSIFRATLEEPFGVERMRGFVSALADADARTTAEIADLLISKYGEVVNYEHRLVFVTWAARDADAALDYVLRMSPNSPQRTPLASVVLRTVSAERPEVARVWFQSLSPDELDPFRHSLAAALIEGWPAAEVGFEGVSEILASMPFGAERERAARMLVAGLVEAGQMDVAMQWAESVPTSAPHQLRALAFRKVALTAGPVDPMRVSDWLQAHRDHRQGQAGMRILARTWAKTDPQAALAWGLAQPDDRARFLSLKFAFQQYYDDAPEAAAAWLVSRPDDMRLDPARVAFALSHRNVDPVAAAEQARLIQDETQRDDILRKVIRHWVNVGDATQAREWVEESGLFDRPPGGVALIPEAASNEADEATEDGPIH